VPGGLFGFTAETHAGDDVILGDKLRYAHGVAHVRAAIAGAGLTLVSLDDAWARQEAGVPAPGLVAVARA
jgi:predicted TPR repeat methyltransferase